MFFPTLLQEQSDTNIMDMCEETKWVDMSDAVWSKMERVTSCE